MALPRRLRLAVSAGAALAVVVPLAWLWRASLLPPAYSVMSMGYADDGGARAHRPAAVRDIRSLVADPRRAPDVQVTLTARRERFRLASGRESDGYTLNGRSPGPEITAVRGQLVQVRLVNASVPGGVTLHWHGVDVPGAEDGVAGVTQDAVPPGGSYVYRFVARQAGTFWYHSHQLSHEQVAGGLLGALVVRPAAAPGPGADVVALTHLYDGVRTVNGSASDLRITGARARVRVINTDNGPMPVWVTGGVARLVAVDGTDLHGPGPIGRAAVLVTSGGRADLEVAVPAGGAARVQIGGPLSVVVAASAAVRPPPPAPRPPATLDLLAYGTPAPAPFDASRPDRVFRYAMGRRPGFLDGVPGLYWTVNGHLFPDVPMFVVAEGDLVRMTVVNDSGEVHPMHLHGHHALVLSRDGVPATGGPWWVDSLNVEDGESYELAFRADNPGVWVDHCHNLPHAVQGLMVHLMYEGVATPFVAGGPAGNAAE
ncbi:multicopper oxidase family protein [Actinomadura sp. ATCC 31491]|uniref:Multicopper oxidase family protein n=1 Tax=Actinomadura luzonensis TaxID=2805427 RepID=A0ABT0FVG1_9ACTN|nr:multicopper oxidase family protein [Actinomadura luzonensis]MCK2216302.1 multicopper oxidase family protein [Actinomadura luzonensis]